MRHKSKRQQSLAIFLLRSKFRQVCRPGANMANTTDWKRIAEATGEPFPGFIWAYRFRGDGVSERLDPAIVENVLASGDGWVWLHLNLSNVRALDWLESEAPIPDEARALFRQADEHQTLQVTDEGVIFGIFSDLKQEFNEKQGEDIARMRFCVTEKFLLSARRAPLKAVEETRRLVEEGRRFPSAIMLLEAIVLRFCDGVAKVARGLSQSLDRIEDRVVLEDASDERVSIGPLRRTALRIHRQLQHLSILFHDFAEDNETALPEDTRLAAARIERRLGALDSDMRDIHERARVVSDEIAARLAEQANRNLSVLSLLTALFVPPTLVTGVWGMNLVLPFKEDADGLTIVLGICLASTVLVFVVWKFLTRR